MSKNEIQQPDNPLRRLCTSGNETKLDAYTLVQRLQEMDAVETEAWQLERQSELTYRIERLKRMYPITQTPSGEFVTPWHAIYGTRMELNLSALQVSIGALVNMSVIENPTLNAMRLAYGVDIATSWVIPHVAALNAASGASNRMDADSIKLCCKDILCSFEFLTLGEFCIFCQGMRTLKYVTKRSDYTFSSDTIMMGLREFSKERSAAIAAYEREHQKPVFNGDEITYEEWRAQQAAQIHNS